MRLHTVLIALVLLLARESPAQQVFDSHVHLWEGEKSLRQYETEAKTAGIDLVGFGGMWFGGPNQALSVRASHPSCPRDIDGAFGRNAYDSAGATMMATPSEASSEMM